MLSAALSVAAIADSQAQDIRLAVRFRPHPPVHRVVVRPVRPGPRYVWVEEEWTPRGRRYDYHPGYWAVPDRGGAIWIKGHWYQHPNGGWAWMPGHWRY